MFSYFVVKEQSMEPSCQEGDFVLINPVRNLLSSVSFWCGRLPIVGKGISNGVNKMSYLFSNPRVGQLVVLKDPRDSSRQIIKRITAARESFLWVEGDNKERSTDSRDFGWVSVKAVLGQAKVIHKTALLDRSIIG